MNNVEETVSENTVNVFVNSKSLSDCFGGELSSILSPDTSPKSPNGWYNITNGIKKFTINKQFYGFIVEDKDIPFKFHLQPGYTLDGELKMATFEINKPAKDDCIAGSILFLGRVDGFVVKLLVKGNFHITGDLVTFKVDVSHQDFKLNKLQVLDELLPPSWMTVWLLESDKFNIVETVQ